ncbi:MAG: hypothetical protein D6781_12545 [Verrucomicrobia bacterium]|nr:MAG: hypothetical protein D6781_12545 [Verrucomicrobiota bacterium]
MAEWIRGSGELSHQASMLGDLRMKLAEAGDRDDEVPAVARAADDGALPEPGPAVEASGSLRIDLALVLEMALVSPPDYPVVYRDSGVRWALVTIEPACPVPRV